MGTRRIDRKEIEGLPVLAEGYKIFNDDWSCLGYCYADENGSVEGSVHKADGDIVVRKNGLHFCREMLDCYKRYAPLQCNRFAKVRGYGKISEDMDKTACQILEIVEVLTWEGHLEAMKRKTPYQILDIVEVSICNEPLKTNNYPNGVCNPEGVWRSHGVNKSSGVYRSDGVNISKGVYCSDGVNNSNGVNISFGVRDSHGVNFSKGVNDSFGLHDSRSVNYSYGVNFSKGVNDSKGVHNSCGVNCSQDVEFSDGINDSYGVDSSYGVSDSYGANQLYGCFRAWFCYKSTALSECAFCYMLSAREHHVFNKPVTEERFFEISDKIKTFGWFPRFTNTEILKEGKEWEEVPAHKINGRPIKEAYSEMPKEMLEYIRSLPEYDEDIFNEITGGAFKEER